MKLKDRNILVVGLGASGLMASNFLLKQGARLTITDIRSESELQNQIQQLHRPVRLSLGSHRDEDFTGADLIILSPGVPTSLPQLRKASRGGIPVYSEVELAYRFLKGTVIGVTGSNGKTTTTALIGELFRRSGAEHVVAGNIGPPLIGFVEGSTQGTTFVTELSSFQLETIEKFRCHVALMLNVTPDHLDRYTRFEDYLHAKERIFLNQGENDYAVVNADNVHSRKMAEGRSSRVVLFSRRKTLREGVFLQGDKIRIVWQGREHCLMSTREIRLKGAHNQENILAAAAAGYLSNLDLAAMADSFRAFRGVEHRLESVRRVGGVEFYNDSKATNVQSTYQALRAFDQPLILIMGGKDKGGDFTALSSVMSGRVKLLILLGAASEKIFRAVGNAVPSQRARDMEEAVELANRQARKGDAVLLSPGCASFDMFDNFEHRGRVFKEIVNRLQSHQ